MKFFRYAIFFALILSAASISTFAETTEKSASAPEDLGHNVQIGQTAPDFEIEYTNGKRIKLSELKGKIVMLQFTASWCSVCRKEMPHIESEIFKPLKDSADFVLIGIDLKENAETIAKFQKSTGVSYPITLDTAGSKFELYAKKDAGVTRNIIIDRSGKIVFLTRLYKPEEFEKMKTLIFKLESEK